MLHREVAERSYELSGRSVLSYCFWFCYCFMDVEICGVRANLERRNKLTRAENPSEVILVWMAVQRVLVKDGG